ncbi:helix-turn-helix transcriptional regulator [Actinocorallia aurantiaca]|uniref:Helix-turn-helix transcriptional regulator n=1 Tax=Actinocorallia aurantiaca TaxID=46204 RepID=A0ABP6GIC2_9ACTN
MAPERKGDPIWPQKMFVIEMRARRNKTGLSRNKLAEALGCTPQWLAKVETYDKLPSEGLADDLNTYFTTDGSFHRLWEEIMDARKRALIPSGFRPLAEAERDAVQFSIYAPLLVPGILQTEEYGRLVLNSVQRPEKAEELLAVRLERQSIFASNEPPWLFLVIGESVLRNIPQGVREGQCKRLLDLLGDPNISMQVVPVETQIYQGSGFQVLSFDKSADLAYVDGAGSHGHMLTEPSEVRDLTVLFNMIRSSALSAGESKNLICTIMEGT